MNLAVATRFGFASARAAGRNGLGASPSGGGCSESADIGTERHPRASRAIAKGARSGADGEERRKHSLGVTTDRAVGVGPRDVHQRHRGRAELLSLADALDVMLGVGGDDQRLAQLLVGDLALAVLVHLG